MKKIIIILLSLSLLPSFAASAKNKKVISKGEQKFSQYQCNQKVLPLQIEYQVFNDSILVKLKAQAEIKGYQVEKARGVDGLIVTDFVKSPAKDLAAQATDSVEFSYTKPEGRSYFVLDVVALINGKKRMQVISIPIGERSQAQIDKNKENIIEVDPTTPVGRFNLNSGEVLKMHRMKAKRK
jgi:hypothetical protein